MQNIKNSVIKILRWSERYTKADMLYLTKGSFWLGLNRVISAGASFMLAIAFANLLPKEVYGTYKYVLSVFNILAIATLSGMNLAVVQAVASGNEGAFIPAFRAKVQWGLFGSLAGIGVSIYYWLQGNTELTISFLVVSMFLPFFESFNIYDSFLNGRKLFDKSSTYSMIIRIISSLAIVAAIFFSESLFVVLCVYFFTYTLLRFYFLRKVLALVDKQSPKDPETLNYGKHMSVIEVFNIIANYFDRILAFHFLGAVPLAVYSIAVAMPEQIKGFLGLLKNLVLPRFAEESDERIQKGIMNKFIRLTLLSVLITIIYIAAAPFIFKIFFPEYTDSIFYSQIFIISMLSFGLFPAASYLKAKRKIKQQYVSNIASALFQIIIMTVMIIWQGLLGLIIARILSRFFRPLLNLILYYRVIKK